MQGYKSMLMNFLNINVYNFSLDNKVKKIVYRTLYILRLKF